jgi:chromosome segregation ATPase
MVKKRLADVIEEEAQKFTPPQGESVIEVTAQTITEEAPAAETTTANLEKLEKTVKNLQTNLEQAQQKEITLQQKIIDLQSALAEQKAIGEKLTKELDQTKQTALQLAEANSRLITEIDGLTQVKELVKAPPKEIIKAPIKEAYNPLSYKKSHRSPERLQEQPTGSNDDFTDNTWLYD